MASHTAVNHVKFSSYAYMQPRAARFIATENVKSSLPVFRKARALHYTAAGRFRFRFIFLQQSKRSRE